jgi:hypothetical protein
VARWPVAVWQPGAPCSGTLKPISVCLHHQAGSGNPLPVYKSRNVSAHFWIPRSSSVRVYQHVDTSVRAWHGVAHNNYGIGVETEGCGSPPHADPLTEYQLDMFAQLMAWANQAHGIPLKLSEAVDQPGLNYHRCKGGPPTGCPCDVRKNARAEILRRAGGTGTTPPPGPAMEDFMFVRNPGPGNVPGPGGQGGIAQGGICMCSPAGAVNLGNDWAQIQQDYDGSKVPLVLHSSQSLLRRFTAIALR